jgi:hypothetical protein
MSGFMDKLSGAVDNKLNQDAQPGDGVERTADNDANQGSSSSSSSISPIQQKGDD